MVSVFDVAKYILRQKGSMSTWKLQKLCYYVQAWTLVWREGKPMFPEDFQAWRNGPVCRELYNHHRGMFLVDYVQLRVGDISHLGEDDIDNINIILDAYGDKEPHWLREQTHAEAPWLNARDGLDDDVNSEVVITKESMGEYYGSL